MWLKSFCTIAFFALLFSFNVGHAQNWRPFNSSEKYNYSRTNVNHIVRTAYVDSVTVENGDSVYHFNRILKVCDTCGDNICGNGPYYFDCYAFPDQPSLYYREMLDQGNGDFLFRNPNDFLVKTLANQGQAWICDSTTNLIATVNSVYASNILGSVDSLKLILIGNSDTLIISKSHGVIQFPDLDGGRVYHLEGIHGRDLGKLVPGFWEIYDIDSGDVFEYLYRSSLPTWHDTAAISKVTITKRVVSGDSIILDYQEIYRHSTFQIDDTTNELTVDTGIQAGQWIFDESQSPLSKFPHERFRSRKTYGSWTYTSNRWTPMSFRDNLGQGGEKIIGTSYSNEYEIDPGDTVVTGSIYDYGFHEIYLTGLGMIDQYFSSIAGVETTKLRGYYKAKDSASWGSITPDSLILGSTWQVGIEEPIEDKFVIYPNPASGRINIEFESQGARDLRLMNSIGIAILEAKVETKSTWIDVQNLSKGIYFLEMKYQDSIVQKRILITRQW